MMIIFHSLFFIVSVPYRRYTCIRQSEIIRIQEETMKHISESISIFAFEEERDRPTIAHIQGSKLTLMVDAGHSKAHLKEIYADLEKSGLALPDLTVMTHWHWDHTFAMAFVHGLTIAERRTDLKLREIAAEDMDEYRERMMNMDRHILKEYKDQSMTVVPADIVFEDKMEMDLGGIHAQMIHVPSPHEDDCTVILIPEEKVLILGDAPCGPYPEYIAGEEGKKALREALEPLDFETTVGGHWDVQTREEFFRDFL